MARPPKQSLDYFPLDVIVDSKIKLIEAKFGLKGFATVVKLYQHIYGEEGYYCKWDEESRWLFSADVLKITEGNEYIEDFTSIAIDRGLFDQEIFEKYEILTSRGIQERYFEAAKRRSKILIDERILLVKVDLILQKRNNNLINVNNNSEIVDDNATKYSIVYKKEKDIEKILDKTNKAKTENGFYDALILKFNSKLNSFGLSKSNKLFEKVKQNIDKTFEDFTMEQYDKVLEIVSKSKFLKGETKHDFRASFDWIFREDNFFKVLNYCYSDKKDFEEVEASYNLDELDEYWDTVPELDGIYEEELND